MVLHATSAGNNLDRLGKTVCCYGSHWCEEDSRAQWAPVDGRWLLRNCSDDLGSAYLLGFFPCYYQDPSRSFGCLVP